MAYNLFLFQGQIESFADGPQLGSPGARLYFSGACVLSPGCRPILMALVSEDREVAPAYVELADYHSVRSRTRRAAAETSSSSE